MYWICKVVARFLLRVAFNLKVIYDELPPETGAFVVCGKHMSVIDPLYPLFEMKRRRVYFMAKAELFRTKIGAWFFRSVGAFPIERGKSDMRAMKEALTILRRGDVLGMFPEGTRIHGRAEPERIKTGIMQFCWRQKCGVYPFGVKVKNGKLKFRRRVEVRFGSFIPYEELGLTTGAPEDLKRAVLYVMDKVYALCEI